MSKIIKIIKSNKGAFVSFFELIAGTILLVREIRDFIRLPATTEVWETISLFKYKENTYCLLYLWTILLFAGISYWLNLKLNWFFNQVLLLTLFFIAIIELIFILYFEFHSFKRLDIELFLTLFFAVFLVFFLIWNRMNRKSYLKTIGVKSEMKWVSICLGVISTVMYFVLKDFRWLIFTK
jgi:hypothetical protein